MKNLLFFLMLCSLAAASPARADDSSSSGLSPKQDASLLDDQATTAEQAAKKAAQKADKKKKKKKSKKQAAAEKKAAEEKAAQEKAAATPAEPKAVEAAPSGAPVSAEGKPSAAHEALKAGEEAPEEIKNARMKTEEGSKSPFSGQISFAYAGSSLNHPFSAYAPNPSGAAQPPLVTASGTVSARYRIDKATTVGVGTGITSQTPLQHPQNSTASNPYMDVAHSWKFWKIQNRSDAEVIFFTEQQAHQQYGEKYGLWLSNEAYYEFDFGLTVGLYLELDVNSYSNSPRFNGVDSTGTSIRAGQNDYVFYPQPYLEFTLSKKVNLRSVFGVEFDHLRTAGGFFDLYGPKVTQTFGVGISATDWLFLYPYVRGVPYSGSFGVKTTTAGLQAIINLF